MTSNNQRRRKPRRRSSFPPPSFPRPTRHSCGGRNPSSLPLRAPPVIPAPHPSFLRRQESIRGNPCGCPFPAPTRFHPLIPSAPSPHPSFLRRQESILPPRPPPVGATLVVARSRREPVFIPICGLRKATRHSCGGRNPSSSRPPRPSRHSRAPVIPAEAGIHPHSCGGRNPSPPRPLR